MGQWGPSTLERAYFNGAVFSFLNYVNINSFQSYSLGSLILLVFLFLGLKYDVIKSP